MANNFWFGGLVALLSISVTAPARALDYSKRAYDSTFVTTSSTGTTTMRLASDGKGHMMSETQAPNYHVISLFDYPGKVNLTIRPEAKRIIKMSLDGQPNPLEGIATKPTNAVPLGAKVIDGHPCKGWQYGSPASGKMEVWMADDIELAVKTVMTPKVGGTRTTVLKSYSSAMPPASAFVAPVGYQVIEMPNHPPEM